jgi:hypothetical protein
VGVAGAIVGTTVGCSVGVGITWVGTEVGGTGAAGVGSESLLQAVIASDMMTIELILRNLIFSFIVIALIGVSWMRWFCINSDVRTSVIVPSM